MNFNLQVRVTKWQSEAIEKAAIKHRLNRTDIARFALNYLFVNYKGKIDTDVLDEIEFKARKTVS